jgi:DNA-binding MarR family transcriptional regulator
LQDEFDAALNTVLVDTFRLILKVEEQMLKSAGRMNLSINEIHLIEAVGKQKEGRTISELAVEIGITLPSVTVAINRLMKKDYVQKTKREGDGRMVYVTLTRAGEKINHVHRYFHKQMIRDIAHELSPDEQLVFLKGMNRINQFFERKSSHMEAK